MCVLAIIYIFFSFLPVVMLDCQHAAALEHAMKNGIFDPIDHDLVFDNESTNQIKMNHIKTMLCGNLIGIDQLERLNLL